MKVYIRRVMPNESLGKPSPATSLEHARQRIAFLLEHRGHEYVIERR